MKKIAIVFLMIILCANISKADDSRYINAMKKNITLIDSIKNLESAISLSHSFLRIANAEKNKWLPFYYASYMNIIASYIDTVKASKDVYLDEAQKFIMIADSLQPNESEIYVLRGMILQSRLQVDPMNRFMKYGNEMNAHLRKAQDLNPKNPRPDYLLGMNLLYTPEAFGGGPKAAKATLESAMNKFNGFIPKDELMPTWGKQSLEGIVAKLPK